MRPSGSGMSSPGVMQFIASFFWRSPWLVVLVYALMTINAVAEVLNPLLIGYLIDAVSSGVAGSEASFRQALIFAVLLGLQSLLFHATLRAAHMLNCVVDSRVERSIANETYDRIQLFSTSWHANTFAGSIVTKIKRAMAAAHRAYDIVCYDFYPALIISFALIFLIGMRSPFLGVLFAAFFVVYILGSIWMVGRYVLPMRRAANRADNRLGGGLADAITGNAVVKVFAREDAEHRRMLHLADTYMIAARCSWLRANIVALLQAVIIMLLRLSILACSVWFWYIGHFSPGDVAFLIISYGTLTSYLRTIGQTTNDFIQALNDTEDAAMFHTTPLQVQDTPHAQQLTVSTGTIAFDTVTFSYPGQASGGFSDLSVTIPPGQRVALVGHSGAGKSTFVKLIQRLHDLDAGQILVDGQDISQVTQQSLRRNVALVPQEPILFHRSLAENIAYGKPRASRKEIEKAAKAAHAHEFIAKLPQGYDTLVGERGVKLSGGERQRVAIARAMLADSPILILDEATSALDSESEGYIQDALEKLMQGRTSIVVAHRLSTIRSVDRILVFEGGKIVEDGTHTQLLKKRGGIYKKLYQLQQGGYLGE